MLDNLLPKNGSSNLAKMMGKIGGFLFIKIFPNNY